MGNEDAWTTLAPANELIRLESIMEREPTDPNEVNEQEDIPEYTASTSFSNTAMPLMEATQSKSCTDSQNVSELESKHKLPYFMLCETGAKDVFLVKAHNPFCIF